MILVLVAAICLFAGVFVGFCFGKEVSGWCVECGDRVRPPDLHRAGGQTRTRRPWS
ncbi:MULTISPECIES: hypothetical protein [unclassified Micromonospora]|uniref:hypothetical protein n=1 Tax=unclassified Micromonospora TaxID=2617518 RepID=UPI003A8849A6